MKILTRMVVAIFSVYVFVIAIVFFFQDKFIFQSVKLSEKHQFSFDVPFDEFLIETTDNEHINALHFKTKNVQALGIIIYFHGNAGNLQRWGEYAVDFTQLDYDVLIIDYRAYGKSSGIPSEKALYHDAEFIWSWAKEKFDYPKWIIYGRSLGAAVASHLAEKTKPDLLGLETPFDDINGALAAKLIPYKFKYKFSNKDRLAKIDCKKIIFHGTHDWVVPLSSALKLRPLLKKEDQFVIITKGGHKNLREFKIYHKKLEEFLLQ